VPESVGAAVTKDLSIPTIGIGAGRYCDGQVLVFHDFLGISPGPGPRFVKRYADLGDAIVEAARRFKDEVAGGEYPGLEHIYN
jgi:3-methyl-2-oxobutanoate hydroxymethyltransferase